jgi:hypothetical protein
VILFITAKQLHANNLTEQNGVGLSHALLFEKAINSQPMLRKRTSLLTGFASYATLFINLF